MNNFERIKNFDKADMIEFIFESISHCADGHCNGCPLEHVKNTCTPMDILRWFESESDTE